MKVVMLSLQDHTGSGYKITEAINLNTTNFVEYMVLLDDLSGHNAYKYPYLYSKKEDAKNGWSVPQRVLDHAQSIVDNADIIHLKGDELPKDRNFYGIMIPENKPVIITVSGSFFRRGESNVATPLNKISDYTDFANLVTALTPDLNYKETNGIYTPHAIDNRNINNLWKYSKVPIINHAYSGNNKKGTNEFLKTVKILKSEGLVFDVTITKNITNAECLKQKSEATIFFDQISETGWFGMSGIEAISMGIPVISYISDKSKEQAGFGITPAIVNCGNTVESLTDTLRIMINHNKKQLSKMSKMSKTWAEKVYSYESCAKMWNGIYESM